jgi:hypothetical protein
MGGMRNASKRKERNHLADLDVDGKNNIKTCPREIECEGVD